MTKSTSELDGRVYRGLQLSSHRPRGRCGPPPFAPPGRPPAIADVADRPENLKRDTALDFTLVAKYVATDPVLLNGRGWLRAATESARRRSPSDDARRASGITEA